MTPPPTSIDGTDITGATIDGQDVQEITVDGQTVFSAFTLPVQYSNLIAWYPFDSSTYGGANPDDVTGLVLPGQSGDSTAFNGTLRNGPTYTANGGGTDINAGANSGAFDFEASNNESIRTSLNSLTVSELTLMGWIKPESFNSTDSFDCFFGQVAVSGGTPEYGFFFSNGKMQWQVGDANANQVVRANSSTGTWQHFAGTVDANGNTEQFKDGTSQGTDSGLNMPFTTNVQFRISERSTGDGEFTADGLIDDVRLYDSVLTASQINQIVTNTPHP